MNNLSVFHNRNRNLIGNHRRSAVLLLIVQTKEGPKILLEQRALHMRSQPGDFSLPGGRLEEGESAQSAALRETYEEIGLSPQEVTIHGPLDLLHMGNGRVVEAFVGETLVTDFSLNKEEVERILLIPLEELFNATPEAHELRFEANKNETFPWERIQRGREYPFLPIRTTELFYELQGEHIWGLTAALLKNFVDILQKE